MAISKKKKFGYSVAFLIFSILLFWVIEFTYTPIHKYFYEFQHVRKIQQVYKELLGEATERNNPEAQYQLAVQHYKYIRHLTDGWPNDYEPIYWRYWDDNTVKTCYYGKSYKNTKFADYQENNFSVNDALSSRKFSCEEHNLRKAFYWAKKAAEQGFVDAQVLYALILEEYFPLPSIELAEGLDIPSNPEEAAKFWMIKAGEQKHFYPIIRALISKVYLQLKVKDQKGFKSFFDVSTFLLEDMQSNKAKYHYDRYDAPYVLQDIIYQLNYAIAQSADALDYVRAEWYWNKDLRQIGMFAPVPINGGVTSKWFRGHDYANKYYLSWIESELSANLRPIEQRADRYFAKKQYAEAYDDYSTYVGRENDFDRQFRPMKQPGDRELFRANTRVQSRLAEIYFNGLGMTVDYPKAKEISEYLCNKTKIQESCNMYKAIIDKGY